MKTFTSDNQFIVECSSPQSMSSWWKHPFVAPGSVPLGQYLCAVQQLTLIFTPSHQIHLRFWDLKLKNLKLKVSKCNYQVIAGVEISASMVSSWLVHVRQPFFSSLNCIHLNPRVCRHPIPSTCDDQFVTVGYLDTTCSAVKILYLLSISVSL